MLGKTGFTTSVFEIPKVLVETDLKGSSGLSDSMEDSMQTVYINKSQMMDTLEKFYIFRETKINNQIDDRMTVKSNIIFDTIVRNDPYRGPPNAYSAQQENIQLCSEKDSFASSHRKTSRCVIVQRLTTS